MKSVMRVLPHGGSCGWGLCLLLPYPALDPPFSKLVWQGDDDDVNHSSNGTIWMLTLDEVADEPAWGR